MVMTEARFSARLHEYEVDTSGTVREDGHPIFRIDARGRVTDPAGRLLAEFRSDHYVAGPENRYLGQVTPRGAVPPDRVLAWFVLESDGNVVFQELDTTTTDLGRWYVSRGARLTVALVTHVILLRDTNLLLGMGDVRLPPGPVREPAVVGHP